MAFHEVRFPSDISRGATGGPQRHTDVVVLGSGFEERNSKWADSSRSYNAGYGVKSVADLQSVIAFFEERRGRLYGFRWKDHADFRSSLDGATPTMLDQTIGTGDGTTSIFQLSKTYGSAFSPYIRKIVKPVAGSVTVAVDGVEQIENFDFALNGTTGEITFLVGRIPAGGAQITAGFEFDTPVRFGSDKLEVSLESMEHGSIANIPIVEIRL